MDCSTPKNKQAHSHKNQGLTQESQHLKTQHQLILPEETTRQHLMRSDKHFNLSPKIKT